jgi:hypothetical protein
VECLQPRGWVFEGAEDRLAVGDGEVYGDLAGRDGGPEALGARGLVVAAQSDRELRDERISERDAGKPGCRCENAAGGTLRSLVLAALAAVRPGAPIGCSSRAQLRCDPEIGPCAFGSNRLAFAVNEVFVERPAGSSF